MKTKYDELSDEMILKLFNGLRNRLLSTHKIYPNDDNELMMQMTKRLFEKNIENDKYINHAIYERVNLYKEYLQSLGWSNNGLMILDQNDNNKICEDIKIKEKNSTWLIKIKLSEVSKMMFMPGYTFSLILLDKNGKEIPDDAIITILKSIPGESLQTLFKLKYSDIKMNNGKSGYTFHKLSEINTKWYFAVAIDYHKFDIPRENVMFRLMFDYWTKSE